MSRVKCLVMDVDGTLTDGKVYMGNNEEVFKAFNIKDGCGIHDILIPLEIIPVIITGRKSKILENRCKELGIDNLYQGVENKLEVLKKFVEQKGIEFANVAYIGDDINDLPCMELVKLSGGVIGCPADAYQKIINISEFVSSKNGGEGAVREFIEFLVK